MKRFRGLFALALLFATLVYGVLPTSAEEQNQTSNTPKRLPVKVEKSEDVEKGCAEKAIEKAIKKGEEVTSIECSTSSHEDVDMTSSQRLQGISTNGIVMTGNSERCSVAPYGYVCTRVIWGVYSPNDNKPGIVQLRDVYVIRSKFDPSLSCNWSAEANVFSGGRLVLTGNTGLQANCGSRNVAHWSSGNDVLRGSLACGKYYEAGVLQGAETCTTISP